jgi:hypothetical protein
VELRRLWPTRWDACTTPSAPVTLAVALAAASIAFLLSLSQPFGLTDEGMQYFLTRAWARGEDISRHGPLGPYLAGQYIWLGTVMRALGEEVWVLRLGRALMVGVGAAALCRSLGRHASLAVALATVWTVAVLGDSSATSFASVLVVAAGLMLARETRPGSGALATAAVLAGALAGFREDSAVIALVLVLASALWRHRPEELVTTVLPGLVANLEAPANRWVIFEEWLPQLPEVPATLRARYERVERWFQWSLWKRRWP